MISNNTRAHKESKATTDRRKQDAIDVMMQAERDGGYATMVVRNRGFERRERERKRQRLSLKTRA
jgi:hypothetical protein